MLRRYYLGFGLILLLIFAGRQSSSAAIDLQAYGYTQTAHDFQPFPDTAYSDDYIGTGSGPDSDFLMPDMTMSLADNSEGILSLRVSAPEGQFFEIDPSGDAGAHTLYLQVSFGVAPSGPAGAYGNYALNFDGLTGTVGLRTDGSFVTANGRTELFSFALDITGPVTFTSLTYSFAYDPSSTASAAPLAFAGGGLTYEEQFHVMPYTDPGPRMLIVPEPSSWGLLVLGGGGLFAMRRKLAISRPA